MDVRDGTWTGLAGLEDGPCATLWSNEGFPSRTGCLEALERDFAAETVDKGQQAEVGDGAATTRFITNRVRPEIWLLSPSVTRQQALFCEGTQDYEAALVRIAALMDARPGTEDGDELDVLSTLVAAYEAERFPIVPADPVEAILFRMEQRGLERKDLEPFLGSRQRVSEVLGRRRGLSLDMIRRLHDGLDIPLENLIGRAA